MDKNNKYLYTTSYLKTKNERKVILFHLHFIGFRIAIAKI